MQRIGAPTDCGYCNNWILIFRLVMLIWIVQMAWTFIDRVDVAAHDECIIKYNDMLDRLGQMSKISAKPIDVYNGHEGNISFRMEDPLIVLEEELYNDTRPRN